ncbi:hypothetical protein P7C70_g2236, partial [Phenoliferia sp. Uapishka_3]
MLRTSKRSLKATLALERLAIQCPACSRTRTPARQFTSPATTASPTASTSRIKILSTSFPTRIAPSGRRGVATEAAQPVAEEEEPDLDNDSHTLETDDLQPSSDSTLLPEHLGGIDFSQIPEPLPEPIGISSTQLRERNITQDQPSLSDLDRLHPRRRIIVPTRDTRAAHRKQYADLWETTATNVEGAFTKDQLAAILGSGEGGLDVDLKDQMLVLKMKGRGNKNWKWRPLGKLTKSELVRIALVVRFEMTEPAMLPSSRLSKLHSESVPISEKEAYLISSEAHPIRRNFIDNLGITADLERSDKTGKLLLVLEGDKQAVRAAVNELEHIETIAHKRDIVVPAPALTIPLPLYSRISRMSRAYIESGSEPNTIGVVAVEESSLDRAESLITRAFIHHSLLARTPLFASIATNLESLYYAFVPFLPVLPTPWTSFSSQLVRIQRLNSSPISTSTIQTRLPPQLRAANDYLRWAEERGMNRLDLVEIGNTSGDGGKKEVWRELVEGLGGVGEGEGEGKVEMSVKFGQVLWPKELARKDPEEKRTNLEERWRFGSAMKEIEKAKGRRLFLPSPPARFLEGATSFKPVTTDSDVFWQSSIPTTNVESTLDSQPTLMSRYLRRIVYRPVESSGENEASVSIESEIEFKRELEQGMEYPEILRVRVCEVGRSIVDMIVPEAPSDCQMTLTKRAKLDTETFASIFNNPLIPPPTISHNSTTYILDSDRWIRRTSYTPALSPPVGARTTIPFIQEQWSERLEYDTRGVEVETVLGESGDLKEMEKIWKEGEEEVLRTCKAAWSGWGR